MWDKFYSVGAIPALKAPAGRHELPLRKQRRQMLIPRVIGRFKMTTAKQINLMKQTPEILVWQRNYYEHVIRNEKSLLEIREYISNNPKQWDLDKENPKNFSK